MMPSHVEDNALLAALGDSSDFVLLIDADGLICFANAAAQRLFTIVGRAIIGSPYSDLDIAVAENAAGDGLPLKYVDGHHDWRLPSGDRVTVDCRFSELSSETTHRYLLIGKAPTTATTPRQGHPETDNDRLQRVFDDSGIGMILLDSSASVRQANNAFSSMLGYAGGTLNDRDLREIIHDDDVDVFKDVLSAWQPGERFVSQIEARFLDSQARPVWTLVTISAISTSANEPPLAIAQIQDTTDQQLTFQALRLSQERFQDFASAASDWMWEMGPELRFSYFSRRLTELTGASSLKLLGRTIQETEIEKSSDPALFHALLEQLEQRKPFRNFTYSRKRKGGGESWLSVSGKPIFSEDGKFLGYRGTGTDITERVKVEEALRRSEERARRSVDDAPIPAMVHAEDGEVLNINAMWTEYSGFSHEDLPTIETWAHKAYPQSEIEAAQQRIQNLYIIESPQASGVRPIITKDGRTRLWDFQSSPMGRLSDGRRYVITMAIDVTERREAQEQLRVLSRATDQSKSAITIAKPDGTIQYVNHQYTDMTGYAAGETVGRNLASLIANGDDDIWDRIRTALAEQGNWEGNTLSTRKNGANYWASITIFGIRDDTKEISHFAVIMEDITEMKRTEFELQSAIERTEVANRAKSDFLANMSHELRTPMNAIIGFSEAMTSEMFGPLGSDRYREYIGDIRSSALHLLGIINDILDLSKIEAGKVQLDTVPVDVHLVAQESVELIRPRTENNNVRLSLEIPKAIPRLIGDERALKQILLNLLSNAAKFTPRKGQITVAATVNAQEQFEISVSDTGIGIAEDELEGVLQPFGQATSSFQKPPEGTGLGLSITKSLVEMQNGELIIESRRNYGTTVRLLFPADSWVD